MLQTVEHVNFIKRRAKKCFKHAKKALKDVRLSKMFPLKDDESIMERRKTEKYRVIKAKTT